MTTLLVTRYLGLMDPAQHYCPSSIHLIIQLATNRCVNSRQISGWKKMMKDKLTVSKAKGGNNVSKRIHLEQMTKNKLVEQDRAVARRALLVQHTGREEP